jgi:hypothetical protein
MRYSAVCHDEVRVMQTFKLLATAFLSTCCSWAAAAQACEGGIYLNPQVIQGQGTPQIAGAANELGAFLARSGLPVTPVVSISNLGEALAAVKSARPPCWVYGNPVVGLASGYRPAAVNTEEIRAAILVVAEPGTATDPKPAEHSSSSPQEQSQLLAKLQQATCFGIKSGVTTALVKAEKICGTVVDVKPQTGLGQSYLPTKAAFEWHPNHWVGVITRVQSARATSMRTQIGGDPKIHQARLLVVPTHNASWGYGLYLRPDIGGDAGARVAAQFAALKQPSPPLAHALDIGATFRFVTPSSAEAEAMRGSLDLTP